MTIALICLLTGGLLGYFLNINVSTEASVYIAIAIFAAFDSIMGGIVANLSKRFDLTIFVSGFFLNALLSISIIFLGVRLGIDLYTAVVVVFSIRIFRNFGIIRSLLLNKWRESVKIKNNGDNEENNIN